MAIMNKKREGMARQTKIGQALVELAVLGTIIIAAFFWLLYVIQEMNDEQYLLQQTFRGAIVKGMAENGGNGAEVRYFVVENRKHVTPFFTLSGKNRMITANVALDLSAKPEYPSDPTAEYTDTAVWYKLNDDDSRKVTDSTAIDKWKFVELDRDVEVQITDTAKLGKRIVYGWAGGPNAGVTRQRRGREVIVYSVKDKAQHELLNVQQGLQVTGGQFQYKASYLGQDYTVAR